MGHLLFIFVVIARTAVEYLGISGAKVIAIPVDVIQHTVFIFIHTTQSRADETKIYLLILLLLDCPKFCYLKVLHHEPPDDCGRESETSIRFHYSKNCRCHSLA